MAGHKPSVVAASAGVDRLHISSKRRARSVAVSRSSRQVTPAGRQSDSGAHTPGRPHGRTGRRDVPPRLACGGWPGHGQSASAGSRCEDSHAPGDCRHGPIAVPLLQRVVGRGEPQSGARYRCGPKVTGRIGICGGLPRAAIHRQPVRRIRGRQSAVGLAKSPWEL